MADIKLWPSKLEFVTLLKKLATRNVKIDIRSRPRRPIALYSYYKV